MATTEPPVLDLQRIVKEYGDPRTVVHRVLHGIDLSLGAGTFTALVGPSGSGKTTLLNLLGLLDRPSSGRLRVQGRDTRHLSDRELTALRGHTLGFVFQFHHLLPALTAEENVMLPLAIENGKTSTAARASARQWLRAVGLGHKTTTKPHELSGGQQQRVAIARALVRRPALILADEPTGNLDTETSDEIFELFRDLHDQAGTGFLIVTHDQRLTAQCDRIISLIDGRIASDETAGE